MKDLETKSKINLPKFNFNNLIPKEHFETLSLARNQMLETQRIFATQFAPIAENLIKVQLDFSAQFQSISKNLNKVLNFVPQLDGVSKAFEEFNQKLDETHRKDMVFLPPFLDNYTLPEIRKMLIDTDKSAIEVYYDIFSNKENLKVLINNWSERSHFINEDRITILSDAVDAHIDKKYTLAIPVLLGQLEGLLIESFGINQKQIRHAVGKVFTESVEEKGLSSYVKSSYIMNEIVLEEVFNPNKKEGHANKGIYPHRPTIQHGINTTYYKDDFASTRLIMLIDFVRSDTFQEFVERDKNHKRKKAK